MGNSSRDTRSLSRRVASLVERPLRSPAAGRDPARDHVEDLPEAFMKDPSPESRLAGFIAEFSPEVAAVAEEALAKMRNRLPGAVELVYDNYNALAIGFGPSERSSEAIFSIVLYPRWVSLFFLQGATLADPKKLLRGTGTKVRHIVLAGAADLDQPAVRDLMKRALKAAPKPISANGPRRLLIRMVFAKRRPRRPAAARRG